MMNKNNEIKILGYAFANKEYLEQVLSEVTADAFESYGKIYSLLNIYYKKYQGVITEEFIDDMFKRGKLSSDAYTVFKTVKSQIDIVNIIDDADLRASIDIQREDKTRQMQLNLAEMIANNKSSQKINEQMQRIIKFTQEKGINIPNLGTSFHEDTENRFENYTNPLLNIDLIKSGYKEIDDNIGGFKPEELIYVIGRKGAGKSVLMLNLGYNMWKQGKNILFITLEISKEDYQRRLDSLTSGILASKFKLRNFNEFEKAQLQDYLNRVKNRVDTEGNKMIGTMHIVQMSQLITVAQVNSKIDEIEKEKNIKFDAVIVDYAGILSPNVPQKEDRLKHGQIALDLKKMSQDRKIIVISGAQMNRAGEKADNASSSHIANSDAIADHLDYGFSIKVDPNPEINVGKIESFKTRDGAPCVMHFNKWFERMHIEEVDKFDLENIEWSE